MGASVNKVILVGNLGADPSTRYMPNGDAVTNIAIATTEKWKDKNTGEKKEAVEWHRVTFYRQLAEIASKFLKKGSSVYIEGKLQTRKWVDKEGVERFTTEIIADTMQMLSGKQDGTNEDYASAAPRQQQPSPPSRQQANKQRQTASFEDDPDSIPF